MWSRHVPLFLAWASIWGTLVMLLPLDSNVEKDDFTLGAAGLGASLLLGVGAAFVHQSSETPAAAFYRCSLFAWAVLSLVCWLANMGVLYAHGPQATATAFGLGRALALGPMATFAFRAQRFLNKLGHMQWLPPFAVLIAVVFLDLRENLGVVVASIVLFRFRFLPDARLP